MTVSNEKKKKTLFFSTQSFWPNIEPKNGKQDTNHKTKKNEKIDPIFLKLQCHQKFIFPPTLTSPHPKFPDTLLVPIGIQSLVYPFP